MPDIKTILRELSVIVGIIGGNNKKDISEFMNPNIFCSMILKYCKNVQKFSSEIKRVKSLDKFDSEQQKIITNGIILGKELSNYINNSDNIVWEGPSKSIYPFDIRVNGIGISLKEDSYILKNPAFSDYLNALIGKEKYKRVHVFREFANDDLEDLFQYCFLKLKEVLIEEEKTIQIFSYVKNQTKYYIRREGNYVVLGKIKNGNVDEQKIEYLKKVSEIEFDKKIKNDIKEHTFSKWIKQNLEKNDIQYLKLKERCSTEAGNSIIKFLNHNIRIDSNKILEILQIYDRNYYYAKVKNGKPHIYFVPSKSQMEIIKVVYNFKVPKSQLNLLFEFYVKVKLSNSIKDESIKMHVECRYSHGQLNGIPEAKLYCKDELDKLYEKIN